jgi:hypothetical protein
MSSLSLSHIPRRLQIALLVVLALVVLWVGVLQKMVNSSSTTTTSSPPASAATPHRHVAAAGAAGAAATAHAAHHARSHAASSKASHHATPAAHAAARHAHSHAGAAAAGAAGAVAVTHAHTTHAATPSHATATTPVPGATHPRAAATSPAAVKSIEERLGEGKTVLLLFWDPSAKADQFVHHELEAVGHSLGRSVAVFSAKPTQVGEFGAFTQKVLVTETPTILLITPAKHESTLVGYNEEKSIKQAIAEARSAESTRSSAQSG